MFDVYVEDMGSIRRSDEPTHGDLLICHRESNDTFVNHMFVRGMDNTYYILELDTYKFGYGADTAEGALESFIRYQEKVVKNNFNEIFLVKKNSYKTKIKFTDTYGYRNLEYDRHYVSPSVREHLISMVKKEGEKNVKK